MTAPPRDDAAVRKEAVAWYVRLCSGSAGDADRQAWRRWHAAHLDHQRAWQRIEAMRATLRQAPAEIASPLLRARLATGGQARRQVLRSVLLLASTGTAGYLSYQAARQHGLVQPMLADYRTGVGAQRRVMLPDGSLLVLNTGSAVDLRYDAAQRRVRLLNGEILVETARHRQAPGAPVDPRPFMIDTAQGTVRALGTRFTVRQFGDHAQVAVLDDAVELRAARRPARAVIVRAGQQARLTASGVEAPPQADDSAGLWQSGSLLVNDRSLGEVVAELARYRRGRLACDPRIAHMRISGVFPLADTDRALLLLVQSFPLRLRSTTRYWVSLEAA
ncbi:transmembrane sensor [Janthinobacterium psychrotolerans]|uniref:Transmembrane sensor n=2 Tax=Janthinobacterium psychrotolerans TaxID=1747903 RepID=A0A1A7C5S2_9BURK|nr:transmembrane sensor [Janthinobacterium psychrotolerans]